MGSNLKKKVAGLPAIGMPTVAMAISSQVVPIQEGRQEHYIHIELQASRPRGTACGVCPGISKSSKLAEEQFRLSFLSWIFSSGG